MPLVVEPTAAEVVALTAAAAADIGIHVRVAVPPAYIQVPGMPLTEQPAPTWPPPVETPDAIGATQPPVAVIDQVAGNPLLAHEEVEAAVIAVAYPAFGEHEIVVEPVTYCHVPVMPADEHDDPTMPATATAPVLLTQFISAEPFAYCHVPGTPALKHAEPTGPFVVVVTTTGAVHEPLAFGAQLAGNPRLTHVALNAAFAVTAAVAVTKVPTGGAAAEQCPSGHTYHDALVQPTASEPTAW